MPTDAETTKKLLMMTTKALRQMEHELLCYVAVTSILKKQLGLDDEAFDRLLETAREFPSIEQQLREKYDKQLEKILAGIDEAELRKQLLLLLERVGSKGQPN